MKRIIASFFLASMAITASAQNIQDNYSDTWVATDGLGRVMPTSKEVGKLKTDKSRTVGMFYITWHTRDNHTGHPYTADVTKILEKDDSCRFDMHRRAWNYNMFLHWGEPEYGYFLSQDEYVCRHDMSMLSDAGVDVLIMDVTNATFYWKEWEVLFGTMEKMIAEGNKVPQMCFWAYNGDVFKVVQTLYEAFYKTPKYKDLWFYWDGKPLLLYNAEPEIVDPNGKTNDFGADADYSPEVKSFFTLRNMWWGDYECKGKPYVGTEDNWCFGYSMNDTRVSAKTPAQRASLHNGQIEEMAVTPAQHPSSVVGKSWRVNTGQPELGKGDMPVKAFVPWLGKEVDNPSVYGIYFQDRWDEALEADPPFIYLNDWNEWSAGRWPGKEFLHRPMDLWFIDQYNGEFNRTIAPVKDKAFSDNYYMQMVQNIRRYKGVRPVPVNRGIANFSADGDFSKWDKISVSYYDTRGDVAHRNEDGYGNCHYTNKSGRNDIVLSRVAVGQKNICFYVCTDKNLSSWRDSHWMLLFIDADRNNRTGWCGYDYAVNLKVLDSNTTTLQKYDASTGKWQTVSVVNYALKDNKLEIQIPRASIGLTGGSLNFDFKWCDNPANLDDAISLCTDGDSAPNRRFNYRFIWER